jgi:hypothetical protein
MLSEWLYWEGDAEANALRLVFPSVEFVRCPAAFLLTRFGGLQKPRPLGHCVVDTARGGTASRSHPKESP